MDDQMTEWKSKLDRMSIEFIGLNQKFDKFGLTDKVKEQKGGQFKSPSHSRKRN